MRIANPPFEVIDRSIRTLDGVNLVAVRMYGDNESNGLEVLSGDGHYAVQEFPVGVAEELTDVERVIAARDNSPIGRMPLAATC